MHYVNTFLPMVEASSFVTLPIVGGLEDQEPSFFWDMNTYLHIKRVVKWNIEHPDSPVGQNAVEAPSILDNPEWTVEMDW